MKKRLSLEIVLFFVTTAEPFPVRTGYVELDKRSASVLSLIPGAQQMINRMINQVASTISGYF